MINWTSKEFDRLSLREFLCTTWKLEHLLNAHPDSTRLDSIRLLHLSDSNCAHLNQKKIPQSMNSQNIKNSYVASNQITQSVVLAKAPLIDKLGNYNTWEPLRYSWYDISIYKFRKSFLIDQLGWALWPCYVLIKTIEFRKPFTENLRTLVEPPMLLYGITATAALRSAAQDKGCQWWHSKWIDFFSNTNTELKPWGDETSIKKLGSW